MTFHPTSADTSGGLEHAALLHRGPEQLHAGLVRFLRDGRDNGEPVLVAVPIDRLETHGDALDAAGDALTVLDITEVGRNPSRLIPLLADWLAAQTGPARVICEVLWPQRSYAESAECLRTEALLNHVLADIDVSVLCLCDAGHLDPELLTGAELTHPRIIDDAGPRPSRVYGDPLELARGGNWPQSEPAAPVSELEFDGDLRQLRHALASDPLVRTLDPTRREDLVFAVNEAVSNALRHGDGLGSARLWRDCDRIVGEVCTSSAIEDPLAGHRTPGPDDIGGRGLWLINQVCDLVEVRNARDGASVRMHVTA